MNKNFLSDNNEIKSKFEFALKPRIFTNEFEVDKKNNVSDKSGFIPCQVKPEKNADIFGDSQKKDKPFKRYQQEPFEPSCMHKASELRGNLIKNGCLFLHSSSVVSDLGSCHAMAFKGGVTLASHYVSVQQLEGRF